MHTSLISIPFFIGLIWATVRYGLAFDRICQRLALPSTTRTLSNFLTRAPQSTSLFPAVRTLFPRFDTFGASFKGRLTRFVMIYVLLTALAVFSFGAIEYFSPDHRELNAFIGDFIKLAPGAFTAYWIVSALTERALDAKSNAAGFKSLLWVTVGSVAICLLILILESVPSYAWGDDEFLGQAMMVPRSLGFVKPDMISATWQLVDRAGHRTNDIALPFVLGGPAHFVLSAYHSDFAVFFTMMMELLAACAVAIWLLAWRSFASSWAFISRLVDVKKHPYLYVVLPVVLLGESIALALSFVAGLPH